MMLVLTNAVLWWLICLACFLLAHQSRGLSNYSVIPALLSAYLFSAARDLSEITEGAMLAFAILFALKQRWWGYMLFASLCVLARETSVFFLGWLPAVIAVQAFRKSQLKHQILPLLLTSTPIFVAIFWKVFLRISLGAETYFNGTENLSWVPLGGIYDGFLIHLNQGDTKKGYVEILLWFLSVTWYSWYAFIASRGIGWKNTNNALVWLKFSVIAWLAFAAFFTLKIWEDDWSFVRVFGAFSLVCTTIVIHQRIRLSPAFILFTLIIFGGNLLRIWINQ